jgi:hypothetical protein
MTRFAKVAATFVLAVSAAACGSSAGGPAGVDSTKQVSAASTSDKEALCDWFAPMAGGYGNEPACADWILSAPPSKADCIAGFPVCAVTIAQFESCITKVVAAQNTCTEQSLSAVEADPDCQAVVLGGCFGN